MQIDAADKTTKFAAGEIQTFTKSWQRRRSIHSMMLLLELRKKAIEGYQELMRTPV